MKVMQMIRNFFKKSKTSRMRQEQSVDIVPAAAAPAAWKPSPPSAPSDEKVEEKQKQSV